MRKARDCVDWTDNRSGRFRIKDTEGLAKKWGVYKHKSAMNYDKMSRAMRYYYRREIFDKISGRLVYKFTENIMKQIQAYRPSEVPESESESEDSTESESSNDDSGSDSELE